MEERTAVVSLTKSGIVSSVLDMMKEARMLVKGIVEDHSWPRMRRTTWLSP